MNADQSSKRHLRPSASICVHLCILLFSTLAASSAAGAATASIERIEVQEVGLYCARTVGTVADATTAVGERAEIAGVKMIAATRTVPARLGTKFGFRYRIVGMPERGDTLLTLVLRYPPPGLGRPSASPSLSDRVDMVREVEVTHVRGFEFGEPWMIVPGVWTFELWAGGRKLAEERFTVVETVEKYPSCEDGVS